MDAALARANRAVAQDPTDPEAAGRLERLLLRAGRADEVAARYRARLVCAGADAPVEAGAGWRCGRCGREPRRAAGQTDAAARLVTGEAVLVLEGWVAPLVAAWSAEATTTFAAAGGGACLVVRAPAPRRWAVGSCWRETFERRRPRPRDLRAQREEVEEGRRFAPIRRRRGEARAPALGRRRRR